MNMNDSNMTMTLRALEPEDLDFLYSIENETDMWVVGCTNVPYSYYTLQQYILNSTNDIYADKQMRLVILDENNKPVGLLDLFNFEPRHLRAEMGIAVKKTAQNQGYGQNAVKLAIKYAKNILHLHQICALVDLDNIPSMKLFLNSGFKHNATLKHWLYDGNTFHDVAVMQFFL